jgi:hypothetical protein
MKFALALAMTLVAAQDRAPLVLQIDTPVGWTPQHVRSSR